MNNTRTSDFMDIDYTDAPVIEPPIVFQNHRTRDQRSVAPVVFQNHPSQGVSSCDRKLSQLKKTKVLSDVTILPSQSVIVIQMSSAQFKLDRFSFNTVTHRGEGSFGAIYNGKADEMDPLKDRYNRNPEYALKLLKMDSSPENVQEVSLELNIQKILCNIDLGIRIPYVYNKLFIDTTTPLRYIPGQPREPRNVISRKIGYISEYIQSSNYKKLILGTEMLNGRQLPAVRYSVFKTSFINPINRMYKSIVSPNSNFTFKHNDLHTGNVMIRYIDSLNLEPIIIDFGLSNIKKVHNMELNNLYLTTEKIKTYYRVSCFHASSRMPFDARLAREIISYMTDNPFSDYHLLLFSFYNQVIDVMGMDPHPNIKANWDELEKDINNRYGFLTRLNVQQSVNGPLIHYTDTTGRVGNIPILPEYKFLYYMMTKLISRNFTTNINTMVSVGNNLNQWKPVSLFIEFYMKHVDPISYNNCIREF